MQARLHHAPVRRGPVRAWVLFAALFSLTVAAGWSAGRPRSVDEEHDTPLEAAMDELGSGQRKLRKLVTEPSMKEQCLETVAGMQAAALAAFQNAPAPLEGAQPTSWRIEFQRTTLKLLDELLKLELAVFEDRTEDAQASFAALGEIKSAGHERFQPKDEE